MKPTVIERDGVKMAIAVQVNVRHCNHGAGSPQLPRESSEAGPAWLENVCEAIGVAADGCAVVVRRLAIWTLLGVGRSLMLVVNLLGLLGAVLARQYLLGWARMGGTDRQLSRRISPWLRPGPVPADDVQRLTAKVLESPKVRALPPHTKTTWTQLAAAEMQTEQQRKRLK